MNGRWRQEKGRPAVDVNPELGGSPTGVGGPRPQNGGPGGTSGGGSTRPSAEEGAEGAAGNAELSKAAKDRADAEKTGFADSWVARNPGYTALGLGAAALAAAALINMEKSESVVRTIIKVEQAETGLLANKKEIKITFTPETRITKNDMITISGSKTTPTLDGGGLSVNKVLSDSAITIMVSNQLTDMTPGGTITVKTGFAAQMSDVTGQTAETFGEVGGSVAGGVAGGVGEGIGGLFSGIMEGGGPWLWVIIGVVIIFLFKR